LIIVLISAGQARKIMYAGIALWKSTQDALNSLGRSTMQTLSWQLSKSGFGRTPDNFDINKFAMVIKDLLGEAPSP
jgi:hypothetical protein